MGVAIFAFKPEGNSFERGLRLRTRNARLQAAQNMEDGAATLFERMVRQFGSKICGADFEAS